MHGYQIHAQLSNIQNCCPQLHMHRYGARKTDKNCQSLNLQWAPVLSLLTLATILLVRCNMQWGIAASQ